MAELTIKSTLYMPENIILSQLPTYASTVATFAAAYATYKAWQISKQSLNFQKSLVKNKESHDKISILISKFIELKTIMGKDFGEISDEDFQYSDELIADIKKLTESINISLEIELKIPYLKRIEHVGIAYEALDLNKQYFEDVIRYLSSKQMELIN